MIQNNNRISVTQMVVIHIQRVINVQALMEWATINEMKLAMQQSQ